MKQDHLVETTDLSRSQQIPSILMNSMIQYRTQNRNYLSLSKATPIQSTISQPVFWKSLLIVYYLHSSAYVYQAESLLQVFQWKVSMSYLMSLAWYAPRFFHPQHSSILVHSKPIKTFNRVVLLLRTFLLRDDILITILEGVLARIFIYFNDFSTAGQ